MQRAVDLLTQIEETIHRSRHVEGLHPALRDAFLACPRDRFIDRPEVELDRLYTDRPFHHPHAGPAGHLSTDSQPSYMLTLASLLDPRPGHRVLEVGSGGGWLLAMLAHAVGKAGRATGIEILPDLAARSRRALAGLRVRNAAVITGDGRDGAPDAAPFDRVIVTAAAPQIPAALFGQVRLGGRIVIPLTIAGPGVEVWVLRRMVGGFRSQAVMTGTFVPLVENAGPPAQDPEPHVDHLPQSSERTIRDTPLGRFPFRAFMTKAVPGFFAAPNTGNKVTVVGVRAGQDSVAICRDNVLVGYGTPDAAERFLAGYRAYAALRRPSSYRFELTATLVRDQGGPPRPYVERRGPTQMSWDLTRRFGSAAAPGPESPAPGR